jgi:adenylate kinase family enzyme
MLDNCQGKNQYVKVRLVMVSQMGVTVSMAIKIFLLGRPGSGKSTAARYIYLLSRKHDWSTLHINDYPFLFALFEADIHHQQFQPSSYGGFDVTDFSVLDTVLKAVEHEAEHYQAHDKQFLLLEFARNDYHQALQQFKPEFLQDSYFLFFTTDIDTCIHRVYQRSCHPTFNDDHFISEEMIRTYYHEDYPLQPYRLCHEHGINERRIRIIDNSGSRTAFYQQIKAFTEALISRDAIKVLPTPTLVTARGNEIRTYKKYVAAQAYGFPLVHGSDAAQI